jgi:hypothetical protein
MPIRSLSFREVKYLIPYSIQFMEISENLKFNNKERPGMNLKKRILIKLGIVISLMVVNVIAATPGSSCMITVYSYYGIFKSAGTVSADGTLCIPNIPLSPNSMFAYLNDGLPCNRTIIWRFTNTASCPN